MPMTDEQEQEILNALEEKAWKELEIHKSNPGRMTWAGVIEDLTVIDLCQRIRSGYQVGDAGIREGKYVDQGLYIKEESHGNS